MPTEEEIKKWCEDHLFGNRVVEGIRIPLSPTQLGVMSIAVEIIQKWENRKECE